MGHSEFRRDIPSAHSFLDDDNCCDWARKKVGVWKSISVSHIGVGTLEFGLFSVSFLGIVAGIWIRFR